jgi:hypothetical protein
MTPSSTASLCSPSPHAFHDLIDTHTQRGVDLENLIFDGVPFPKNGDLAPLFHDTASVWTSAVASSRAIRRDKATL